MRRALIYLTAAVIGALVSAAITFSVVGRLGYAALCSALLGAGLSSMFAGTAWVGWQYEEETDRKVTMSRRARLVWLTIGIVTVVANGLAARWLSSNILSDN